MSDTRQAQIEAMAEAIYNTHWREPSPVWVNVSDDVKKWVVAQAEAALNASEAQRRLRRP